MRTAKIIFLSLLLVTLFQFGSFAQDDPPREEAPNPAPAAQTPPHAKKPLTLTEIKKQKREAIAAEVAELTKLVTAGKGVEFHIDGHHAEAIYNALDTELPLEVAEHARTLKVKAKNKDKDYPISPITITKNSIKGHKGAAQIKGADLECTKLEEGDYMCFIPYTLNGGFGGKLKQPYTPDLPASDITVEQRPNGNFSFTYKGKARTLIWLTVGTEIKNGKRVCLSSQFNICENCNPNNKKECSLEYKNNGGASYE